MGADTRSCVTSLNQSDLASALASAPIRSHLSCDLIRCAINPWFLVQLSDITVSVILIVYTQTYVNYSKVATAVHVYNLPYHKFILGLLLQFLSVLTKNFILQFAVKMTWLQTTNLSVVSPQPVSSASVFCELMRLFKNIRAQVSST